MPFQLPARLSPVLASALAAAGIMLTVASCSHLAPLGPDNPARPVTPRHLASPIILQAMRSQPATPSGACPPGWVAPSPPGSPGPGMCYRDVGTPATITSAGVGPIPTPAASQRAAPYGYLVTVPAAEVTAVTAVIEQAYDARGAVAVNVAGKTWSDPEVIKPFPGRQLEIALPNRTEALQLYRMLFQPS